MITTCECDTLDDDLIADGWTCYTCYETDTSNPIRLTRRGKHIINATVITAFIAVMGFVGWLETSGM
jgi:hypothetical protein